MSMTQLSMWDKEHDGIMVNVYHQEWPSSFGGWRTTLLSDLYHFLEDLWWAWTHSRKNLLCITAPLASCLGDLAFDHWKCFLGSYTHLAAFGSALRGSGLTMLSLLYRYRKGHDLLKWYLQGCLVQEPQLASKNHVPPTILILTRVL